MARATGVQISGSAVRVVDLDGSGRKYRVRGFAEAPISAVDEADRGAAIARAVKEAFKTSKASREHVVLGIPTRDCIIREITIPFTDLEQIRKVIKFESESHLHSCSIDEVVICFHKVAELGNRSSILVVAARKTLIQECLRALESHGIDPLSIDVDAAGLFALLKVLPQTQDKKNYVVCEIGYTSTMILLVRDGDLRIVRSVRMGTDSIHARVGRDLDIAPGEARTRTQQILAQELDRDEDLFVARGDVEDVGRETDKTSADLERDVVRQRQAEMVVRLQTEIGRSINPAKLDEPLDAVFLTGPGSSLPRLKRDLSERMGVAVEQLDVLSTFDHRYSAEDAAVFNASIATGSGLAIEFAGNDPLGMDFRQEEFVFAKRFDRLKVPLFCLVALIAFLNALWFHLERQQDAKRDLVIDVIADRASAEFQKVMDPAAVSPTDLERYPVGADALRARYNGAAAKTGLDRLAYMRNEVQALQSTMRKDYGLDSDTPRRRPGPRGAAVGAPKDIGDFHSALDRIEVVMQAIHQTGVPNVTVNKLEAKPTEVRIGLTLPQIVETAEGQRTFTQILSMITDRLEQLPKEVGFVSLKDQSPYRAREDEHGVDYPLILVEFEKEVR